MRNDFGERGFAQPRRTMQDNMIKGFSTFPGSGYINFQITFDGFLTRVISKALRTHLLLLIIITMKHVGLSQVIDPSWTQFLQLNMYGIHLYTSFTKPLKRLILGQAEVAGFGAFDFTRFLLATNDPLAQLFERLPHQVRKGQVR